jgi:hypothetical protein
MDTLANLKKICAKQLTTADKWRFTLYTTLILLLLFNPWMFIFMNRLLSSVVGVIASKEGCPTMIGFIIHVIVFTFILRYIMDLDI